MKRLHAIIAITILLAASPVFAVETSKTPYCEALMAQKERAIFKIESTRSILKNARDKAQENIASERARNDSWILAGQTATNKKREENINVMLSQNIANGGREAIDTYQTSLEAAVLARRNQIASAVRQFRTTMDTAISNRILTFDASVVAYDRALGSAFDTAIAACKNGTDENIIGAELASRLARAGETLLEKQKTVSSLVTAGNEAATIRRTLIANAIATFKTAVESAKKTLAESFTASLPN